MKTFVTLLLSCFLVLQAVVLVETVGEVETKPLSATKPKRFQFGALIEPNEGDGVLLEHAGDLVDYHKSGNETSKMLGKYVMVGIDPMRYRRTMVTIPIPSDYKGSDFGKLIEDHQRGCVCIKFLAMEDLPSKEKVPENCLVIMSNEIVESKVSAEVRKHLREKKVKLGFLKRFKALEDSCRAVLVEDQIPFIENLELPAEIDLMTSVKSNKLYYGFKLIFAPFPNATSIYSNEKVQVKALVNLADLVVFESDDRLGKFCTENSKNLINFGHKLMSDNIPLLPGFEQPRFVERKGASENETLHWIRFAGQTGSSVIAPYRFDKSQMNVANLSDSFFFSPCIAINSPFGDAANFTVTRGHLEQWEKDKNIRIPENSAVLLNTGFWSRWSTPEKYLKEYPGVDLDAVKWLVEERKVVAIGIDSLAVDDFSLSSANYWPAHGYLAGMNIPTFVNLRFDGADKFPVTGSRCVFTYLRIHGGTSSPISIYGLPGYDSMELSGSNKKSEKKSLVSDAKEKVAEVGSKMKETVVGGGEKKEEPSGESRRWQFGHVIRHQSDNCDCTLREIAMDIFKTSPQEKQKLKFSEITLGVDPSLNKLTTISQPVNVPMVMTKGCVETLFIKTTDLMAIKKRLLVVKEGMMVIFMSTDLMKLHDPELIKEASAKKLCLGFFDDIELPADIRNSLIENNLTVIENLARPEKGFKSDDIDENKHYYGFKFIFAPMKDETSLGESLKANPPRKVNLADVVVFDSGDKEIDDRCSKMNYISLSYNWGPADKVPIRSNISRPVLIEDGKKMVFYDHYGTHLDAPFHVDVGKNDMVHLLDALDRPVCLRVDIPYGGVDNFAITKQHLVDWESKSGVKIPERSLVILTTGFGLKNWANPDIYVKNFPGLALDGAQFLVEDRKVVAIGIDSLLTENYASSMNMNYPTHVYLASKEVVGLENIGGELDKLTTDGSAMCTLAYLRLGKSGGSPVAVFAMLKDTPRTIKPLEVPAKTEQPKKAAASSNSPIGLTFAVLVAIFAKAIANKI